MSELLNGRTAVKARQVQPGTGYAVEVLEGQLLQIIDVQGKQVGDFVAFNLHDRAEFLSVAHTRAGNANLLLQTGMTLLSNRRRPMFELVEDTVGRHDMLYAACDPKRYEDLGVPGHASCRVALTDALTPYEVDYDRVPDPINWFMNVSVLSQGELEVREPISERNDYVILRALMDTLIALSPCPQDQNETNGFQPSDLLVRVYR
jgi:uncharacterized protein YcgI (DUF1989 family)